MIKSIILLQLTDAYSCLSLHSPPTYLPPYPRMSNAFETATQKHLYLWRLKYWLKRTREDILRVGTTVERAPDHAWYPVTDYAIAPEIRIPSIRDTIIEDRPRYLPQTGSSLLIKLPPEIRQLIYVYLLSNKTIGLGIFSYRSGMRELPTSSRRADPAAARMKDSRPGSTTCSILRSCRQM